MAEIVVLKERLEKTDKAIANLDVVADGLLTSVKKLDQINEIFEANYRPVSWQVIWDSWRDSQDIRQDIREVLLDYKEILEFLIKVDGKINEPIR